ncbi:MAG: hypothetical protein Q9165_000332 [Trypethelium subeluteriae]
MLVPFTRDRGQPSKPENTSTVKRKNEDSTDVIEGSPRRTKLWSKEERSQGMTHEVSGPVRSGPLWHSDSDDDSNGDVYGTSDQLAPGAKSERRPAGYSQIRTKDLGQSKLAQTLNERRELEDLETEKDTPVTGARLRENGTTILPEQNVEILDPGSRESEPITEIPDRADGLGIISYYPRFPGSKTSNRDLFRTTKTDETYANADQTNQMIKVSTAQSKANEISATGWQIAKGIIPEQCFTPSNCGRDKIKRMKKNPLFVGQDEDKECEVLRAQQTATAKERTDKTKKDSKGRRKDAEQIKMGISDESRARWQDKLAREARRREESRVQQEHWKREQQNKQRRQELRTQTERPGPARNETETEGHTSRTGRSSLGGTIHKTTNVAEQAWQVGVKTIAQEYGCQALVETHPAQRTDRPYKQKKAEIARKENSKKWVEKTNGCRSETRDCNTRGREAIGDNADVCLRETTDVPRNRFFGQHNSLLDQRCKPNKSVRFDEEAHVSEYDADMSIDDVKTEKLQYPLSAPQIPSVGGGKDFELVKRLYQERQKDHDNHGSSIAESEPSELTDSGDESPVTATDYTYWAYSVQRKEWNSDQDEEDMAWIQCGDIYTSSHHADRAAGKEILLQRGAPQSMFPDADEWSMIKDGAGLKLYSVVTNGYNVKVRVSRVLRTGKDGIPPKSRAGWLKRVVYEVKYESSDGPGEDQDNTKVLPELFTIRGQANQEAANKLIDLSVNPNSQKIDEVQRRISVRTEVNDYLELVEQEKGLFEAEGDDGTGVKVWVEERTLNGPRNL